MIHNCSLTLWEPGECAAVWWSNISQVPSLRSDRWQKGWTLAWVCVMLCYVMVMQRRGGVSAML